MRKEGLLVIIALTLISGFVLADTNVTNNETIDINDFTSEIAQAFTCLEETAGAGCSNTDDISEISLTILASPDNIFSDCVSKLKEKTANPSSIDAKELAQATLALNHAGENVSSLKQEIIARSESSSNVDWIIQGVSSSDEEMSCYIEYGEDGKKYEFDVSPKGKIEETDSDSCFDLTYFDFWIQIDNNCYGKEFTMNCGGDFKIPLFYKKSGGKGSDIYYVLKEVEEGVPNQDVEFSVNSLCVVDGRKVCDYEATLWSAYAFKDLGEPIINYMPYIVTSLETYSTYFPEAFIPIIDPNLNEKYRGTIISKQKTDGSWHMSTYGDQYDTALALMSYGISDDTEKSERWLFTKQKDDGCWKDLGTTAMILWALTQKSAPVGGGSTYDCTDSGYFCLPSAYCEEEDTLSDAYTGCSGASKVCCEKDITESCAELGGVVCPEGKVCGGGTRPSVDSDSCCLYSCIEEVVDTANDCEKITDNGCYSYEPEEGKTYKYVEQSTSLSESCGEGKTCYKKVTKSSNSWIVWVLVVVILGLIGFLVFKYKDKIKNILNKKGKNGTAAPQNNQGKPPFPPSKPGMAPVRPGMAPMNPRGMPQARPPTGLPPRNPQQGGMIRQAPPRRGMPPQNPNMQPSK